MTANIDKPATSSKPPRRPPMLPSNRHSENPAKNMPSPFDGADDPFTGPISVFHPPKTTKPYKDFAMPSVPGDWTDLNESEEMDSRTIHTLVEADSGSATHLPQFLALRTLWPSHKTTLADFLVQHIGFIWADFVQTEEVMQKNETWKAYIDVLEQNYRKPSSKPYSLSSGFPHKVGRFETALENQFDIYEGEPRKNKKGARTRLATSRQLRPRPAVSQQPDTPQISKTLTYDEFDTPGTASKPRLPRAEDEAIVNIALISFLQATWRLPPTIDTRWTAQRKAFKFSHRPEQGKAGKGFTAVTDGHLRFSDQMNTDNSAAILEVKAAVRARYSKGKHQIDMQESAQMALWIAAEPGNHWTSRRFVDRDGKKDKGKD